MIGNEDNQERTRLRRFLPLIFLRMFGLDAFHRREARKAGAGVCGECPRESGWLPHSEYLSSQCVAGDIAIRLQISEKPLEDSSR